LHIVFSTTLRARNQFPGYKLLLLFITPMQPTYRIYDDLPLCKVA